MLGIYGRMVGSDNQWLGGFNPRKKSDLFLFWLQMQELETLLNSLIERGRKPWGLRYFAEVMVFKTYIDFITKKWASSPTSLRELVSLESGLWQFVWDRSLLKSIWKARAKEPSISALGFKSEVLALSFEPEYRLLESALIPEEELGQFLVDNIKVEWLKSEQSKK